MPSGIIVRTSICIEPSGMNLYIYICIYMFVVRNGQLSIVRIYWTGDTLPKDSTGMYILSKYWDKTGTKLLSLPSWIYSKTECCLWQSSNHSFGSLGLLYSFSSHSMTPWYKIIPQWDESVGCRRNVVSRADWALACPWFTLKTNFSSDQTI